MSSCKCCQHLRYSKGEDSGILKLSSKKVKVGTQKFLRDSGLISKHANTVCKKCITYVETNFINKKRKLEDETSERVCNFIQELNQMDGDCVEKVASAIGERIKDNILEDAISIKNSYRDVETLTCFSTEKWLASRNKILLAFLMSATGSSETNNAGKRRCIAGSVDSIYKARHMNVVAPLPFGKNLITYYLSGSKLICQLNGRQQAAGSYSTLQRWLKNVSNTPCYRPNSGDVITFFDNSQVIVRNWRVNYGYKSKASVITTLVHLEPNLSPTLQTSPQLNPYKWLYNIDITGDELLQRIEKAIAEGETRFDSMRNKFIHDRLKLVLSTCTRSEDGLFDKIDDIVRGMYGPLRQEDTSDPYDWIESHHLDPGPTIKVGEPAMKNPCSYESIKAVLQHIQQQNGVGTTREWCIVGCDGLPYVLGNRILVKERAFQNILLIPGLGHIELNAIKACFKLLWEPCLKDIAKSLGYKSPRALLCCEMCTDNHKAWQILSIFLFSTMDEILFTYIHYSFSTNTEPSIAGLYKYIGDCSDYNFRFMCDATFNIVLPLFMFRCGVRRNNHACIFAGKCKFMKLFFGFNMTFYQELMFQSMKAFVLAPLEIKSFLQKTESFTSSGHPSKGEGGDFVLEAINGKIKKCLPPGIPTHAQWLQVCRNIDTLTEINAEQNSDQLGICQMIMTVKDGQALDKSLVTFESQCRRNLNTYFRHVSNGGQVGKVVPLEPVFTTAAARTKFHAVENKTKAQLVQIIQEGISTVRTNGDVQESVVLESQWQKIKVGTKNDVLQSYKEVVAAVENSTAVAFDEEDNVDDDNEDSDDANDDDDDDV